MAAPCRLRTPPMLLLLCCCSALAAAQSQTVWPPSSIPAVDPTTASTTLSRQFLSDEQHRLLTSPSFGQRITSRPRPAARPAAARRDWTPIWPGAQVDGVGAEGGAVSAVTARPARPSRRPDAAPPPSLAPSRPPVTEYYFASSVSPDSAAAVGESGAGAEPTFPPAQLPTATFDGPATTPTRALPPGASRRPTATRLGLADRLSALVTSRPASTTIISPTRAAPEPPSSAALWTTTERPERRQTAPGLGLEPSTWSPELGGSEEPTAAPSAEDSGSSSSSSSSSGEDVSPTPVSPPCVVTPQHPGGYCRDGDILTVFTRDPTGAWAAYRTVQLPSSTVAALDGQGEGENTTQDPVGVTPAPEDRQTAMSTPAQDGGVTVTSAPEPEPTAASVSPLEEPAGDWESSRVESSSSVVVAGVGGGSGARDHLPSAGPPRPSVAGPTLPSDLSARDGASQVTGDAAPEAFPTATSAFPGPQPPTVAAPAAPAAADGGVTEAPSAASEAEKSGDGGSETVAPEEGKVTAPPPLGSTPTEPPPPTQPVTEPPTRGTTRETTGWTTSGTTLRTTPQTTAWEEAETTVQEQTFPVTLEAFTTASEAFTTAAIRAETTPEGPASTTPPPTWPPTTDSSATPTTAQPPTPSPNETAETATAPGGFAVSGGEDWGTATSAAPLETTVLTLAPGSHPETTQHTSDKSAELGKVSISHPTRTSPVPGKTDDGFTTGTFHFTTAGTFDYPSGPTGFTSPAAAGITRRPTHFTTAGSAGFSTTAGRRPTTPGDYDYTTAPSGGNGGGSIGNGVSYGGGFPYGVSNYSTVGHGRLTPPPPPAFQPTTPSYGNTGYTTGFGTDFTTDFSTDFSTPLGTRQPTETGFTSTRGPATTDATTPEITEPETTSYGTTTEGTTTGTTPGTSPSPGITHSSVVPPVEVYVQFLLGTTWPRFCRVRRAFKQRVVDLVNGDAHRNLTVDNAVLFNIPVCGRPVRARRQTSDPAASAILVFLYLTDAEGRYDREMTERVEPLWEAATPGSGHGGLEGSSGSGVGGSSGDTVARMVREVDTVRPEQLVQPQEHAERAGVIAAITVGCVAVASLVLLAVLLVVVRHRRRAAQTAQRCNPVNMEEYGVESVFSSMRRKNKLRRSVRSYLNQAFDDHDAPSNAVNFAGLANLSGDLAALKEEFDSIPTGAMPTLDDLPPGSEDRNRYANVLPVPETRVVLDQKTGAPNSDYINANYVRGPKDEPQFYIATQGPLESTVNDFWRMIWETQSKVVICLTDIVERGVRRCAEYLPPSEALDRHRLYGDFQVTLMTKTKKDKFVVSTIQLKNMDSNLFREVTHLWYSGWPERGVPSDLDSIVEFLQEARRAMKTNIGPTVVHCSPGTGRTGVLLACDICMRQFDASRTADIMRTVFRIRHDRAGAVQTREQYALIYKVLNQYAASVTSGNLPALE